MITGSSVTFLTIGALFGLTAGISPGPLLTLVITETLKHNRTEGIKVAVTPLITDLPIIAATYFIFSKVAQFNTAVGIISLLGGIYFTYLGYETIKTKSMKIGDKDIRPDSLKKGITANLLNPNPYVFWFTAGIPTAFKASEINLVTVILYFLMFYLFLVGSKIMVAVLIEKSKIFLKEKMYKMIIQVLGIVIFMFAIYFFNGGIKILIK